MTILNRFTNNSVKTLVDASTIVIDAEDAPHYQVTITANRTLANPSNPAFAKELWLAVSQDAVGNHTLSFESDWVAIDANTLLNRAPGAISVLHATARNFGTGIKWYYSIESSATSSGGSYTKTGFIDFVTTDLTISAMYPDTGLTETVYRDGEFTAPFQAQSSLSLTFGTYSISRSPEWLPQGTAVIEVDTARSGQEPLRAFSWDNLHVTSKANVKQVVAVHTTYRDPVATAATAAALQGPLVLATRDPPGMWDPTDSPEPSAAAIADGFSDNSNWDSIHKVNAAPQAAAQWTTWLNSYIAAGGREPVFIAQDLENAGGGGTLDLYSIDILGPKNASYYNAEGIWLDIREGLLRERIRASAPFFTFTFPDIVDVYHGGHYDYFFLGTNMAGSEASKIAWEDPVTKVWPLCRTGYYAAFVSAYAEAAALYHWSAKSHPAPYLLPAASPEMYGTRGNASTIYYGTTVYEVFRYEVARFRSYRRSSPLTEYSPWVAYPTIGIASGASFDFAYADDPRYTREIMYHLCLNGAVRLLYFNGNMDATVADDQLVDDTMYEIQQMFGNKPRTSISHPTTINVTGGAGDQTVVSGMKDGNGVYHWRCSFKANVTSVTVNGQPVTILPNHRGVWATSATSTPPTFVVTV